ncbi:HD domain-containing protein [Rhodococcus hoagii]|nr:HD domain-containing protein [Prescottella equi]MBM4654111.1 HD domain-containing protein [Prescottella equi]MBM4719585.1 HD domain-containing protein [Prescottella equi]NKR23384.1 HD domain-containing protein [Prescottella equi]NKT56005.1 HD domain-containing protein [Prescottella equi]
MTEVDPVRGLVEIFSRRADDRRGPDGQLHPGDAAAYAQTIARAAHHGQTDKAGVPYIHHPERVAAAVADNDTAVAVAWLHDVVEDTTVTLSDLEALFSPEIVDAVDAVTRRPGETPDTYYQRVRQNALAVTVKLADIADNSAPTRLAFLDEAIRNRLTAKYTRARAALTR